MSWWNFETAEAYDILSSLDPEEIEWTDDVEAFAENVRAAFFDQIALVASALEMSQTSADVDGLVINSLYVFASNVNWSQVAERLMPISAEPERSSS